MRGQAALEFMTTYGWAIMVVLVSIGALVYFGVLDVGTVTPERCIISTGFGCRDFLLSAGTASMPAVGFVLTNNQGKPIRILAGSMRVECDTCVLGPPAALDSSCFLFYQNDGSVVHLATQNLTLGTDDQATFRCSERSEAVQFKNAGERAKFLFTFEWQDVQGKFPHQAKGEIYATVQ